MKNGRYLAFCISSISLLLFGETACMADPTLPYDMNDRIKDASRLIAKNEEFKLHARQFHLDANSNINESKTLKAGATKLQKQAAALNAAVASLSPMQAQEARNQFALDLKNFKGHATDYQAHLNTFRTTVGECHANEKEYQLNLGQYSLHLDQFHFPLGTSTNTIQPPHMCPRMVGSFRETQGVANQMMYDRIKMNQAESELQSAETKLQNEIQKAAPLASKALTANKRENEEAKIAGEFARLRDEYKTLEAERQFLDGTHNKIPVPSVKARVNN